MEFRENACIDVFGDMRGDKRDHLFNVCDICFRIGKALTCACERIETACLHTSFVVGRPT